MKVLVTGGTGFVGSHTVAALLRGGHSVRVLARRPEAVAPALRPLGVGEVAVVPGDVTDPQAVEQSLAGCDAVVHSASVYSLDPRDDKIILNTNVRSTELVIGTAARLGLDPIVYVSSIAALIGERGAVLGPDSEPRDPPGAYYRSKAASDRVARSFQQQGAPVAITYPPAIWGPHDPGFGVGSRSLLNGLKGRWFVTPRGTVPSADVRDVAQLHAALMEPGRGPRRYMAPTHSITIGELLDAVRAVAGRRLPSLQVPGGALLPALRAFVALRRVLPLPDLGSPAMAYLIDCHHRVDDSATRRDFGLKPRPLVDTIRDSARWLAESGYK